MKQEQRWGKYVLTSQIQTPEAHQRQSTTRAVRFMNLKEGCTLEIHIWELYKDGNQCHENGSKGRRCNIRIMIFKDEKEEEELVKKNEKGGADINDSREAKTFLQLCLLILSMDSSGSRLFLQGLREVIHFCAVVRLLQMSY